MLCGEKHNEHIPDDFMIYAENQTILLLYLHILGPWDMSVLCL